MYCEIDVEHKSKVEPDGLADAVRAWFENPLDLAEAHKRNAIYSVKPPSSICAFELHNNCFVIFRQVSNVRLSTFHLEGKDRDVSPATMLQTVQDFAGQLHLELSRSRGLKAKRLTTRLLEDNGRETGWVGSLIGIGQVLREKLAWKELAPAIITFATAAVLFWCGLDDKLLIAAYSFAVVASFTFADVFAEWWWRRDKIKWGQK